MFCQKLVSCSTCGCAVLKKDAQKILNGGYYCKKDRKPYDKVSYWGDGFYVKVEWVRVNEDGSAYSPFPKATKAPTHPTPVAPAPAKRKYTARKKMPGGKSQSQMVLEKFQKDGWCDTNWWNSEVKGSKHSLSAIVFTLKQKGLIKIKSKGYTDASHSNYQYTI